VPVKIDEMNESIVNAMFETIPMEITIIDANDKVAGWNKRHTRLFYRPEAAMGMDFRDCHPQESLGLVEKIVSAMKSGKRNTARFWIDLTVDKSTGKKHKVLIDFFALRDVTTNAYLGCMECTQDVEEIKALEGEKRLIDEE
jgi:PAS domain S-box-containing protein